MRKSLLLPLMGILLFLPFLQSIGQNANYVDSAYKDVFIKDDFIAASLDSLANLKYFEGFECLTNKELETKYGFSQGYIPVYPDSVYRQRLFALDATTPISLTYNKVVKDYIELYAIKKRALTQRVMGLAKIYFPMFEEQLDKYNMPLELKYLAIVESALNPEARSRVGATGLWQFMYGTGKMYDLNVSSFIDDRKDPLRATIAACEHMTDLYNMYGDWLLVLAAYNSGAGNVNKAIRRSGGKRDFWSISPYLPKETRGYVPAFIGVTYVMSYTAEHNLTPIMPRIHHYEIDTVTVKTVLTFNQITESIMVPLEDLKFLNPTFKAGVIPATTAKPYKLNLPKKYIAAFVNNEERLYAKRAETQVEQEQLVSMTKSIVEPKYHKVKRGENLGLIANKYRCTVANIKKWNRLKSTNIAVGQRLIVQPEQEIEQIFAQAPKVKLEVETKPIKKTAANKTEEVIADLDTTTTNTKAMRGVENIYHKVKSGETLGLIAERNKVPVSDVRKWNNIKGSKILKGQTLIVGKKEIVEAPQENLAQAKPAKKTSTSSQFVYYTVQRGDTLWNIAQKHEGCSVAEIKKLNNIRNEKSLVPGQKIKVAIIS